MTVEPIAVLSDEEKGAILRHLGYAITSSQPMIALGVPAFSQPSYLVQQAVQFIPSSKIGHIRILLSRLDDTERRIFDAQRRLKADKVGEVTINLGEADALQAEYVRWARWMADELGVPLNIYSYRFRNADGGGVNVPVRPI
jgi:hypothetical protein